MKSITRGRGGRRTRVRGRSRRARAPKVTKEFRDYMRKIDAYRAGRAPLPLLKTGPSKIARAVAGLRKDQLRRRPAPSKWSINEIVGHLVDTEYVYGFRLRMALSESGRPVLAYDQPTWTKVLKHQRRSAPQMMEAIQTMRRATLEVVQSVPRRAWNRYGLHPERGKETVRRTLELVAGHDLNHLDQIRAIRRKYGW